MMSMLTRCMCALVFLSGCNLDSEVDCVEVPTSCAPLYEPTFDNVYAQTLAPKCAVGGGSCHSASGAQGNLVLEGVDLAYDGLTSNGLLDGSSPGCGILAKRLESNDSSYVMPIGAKLSEAERCAVHLWIQAGGER